MLQIECVTEQKFIHPRHDPTLSSTTSGGLQILFCPSFGVKKVEKPFKTYFSSYKLQVTM